MINAPNENKQCMVAMILLPQYFYGFKEYWQLLITLSIPLLSPPEKELYDVLLIDAKTGNEWPQDTSCRVKGDLYYAM